MGKLILQSLFLPRYNVFSSVVSIPTGGTEWIIVVLILSHVIVLACDDPRWDVIGGPVRGPPDSVWEAVKGRGSRSS